MAPNTMGIIQFQREQSEIMKNEIPLNSQLQHVTNATNRIDIHKENNDIIKHERPLNVQLLKRYPQREYRNARKFPGTTSN